MKRVKRETKETKFTLGLGNHSKRLFGPKLGARVRIFSNARYSVKRNDEISDLGKWESDFLHGRVSHLDLVSVLFDLKESGLMHAMKSDAHFCRRRARSPQNNALLGRSTASVRLSGR